MSEDETKRYRLQVEDVLNDPAVDVRVVGWDYGHRLMVKAWWVGGEHEWPDVQASMPADTMAEVIRDTIQTSGSQLQLTEAEERAFEFGPRLRRLAQEYCEGRLPEAHARFASPERVEQHNEDVAAMRTGVREVFIRRIVSAGGFDTDVGAALKAHV